MKKLLRFLTCLLPLVSSLATAADPALSAHGATYHKEAKAVTDMVISKNVDLALLTPKIDVLLSEAVALAGAYAKAHPAGEKLLKTVIAQVPAMRKLTFDELQTDWHDLGYFAKPGNEPGLDLKDEDNEHFTDPIHAIVHPLLVLKAAQAYATDKKEEHLQVMKEEMQEGLEQADKLVAKLAP